MIICVYIILFLNFMIMFLLYKSPDSVFETLLNLEFN